MAISVHVGIGVIRSASEKIKRIFPAMGDENRGENEEPDHDTMGDELVADHGLQKQGQ